MGFSVGIASTVGDFLSESIRVLASASGSCLSEFFVSEVEGIGAVLSESILSETSEVRDGSPELVFSTIVEF